MWWAEISTLAERLARELDCSAIDPAAVVEDGAVLDTSRGPLRIGAGARICRGAIVQGPGVIGENALVGTNALLRGPFVIGRKVQVGYATEVKNAIVEPGASFGPMCFIADSLVEAEAYLGAMVRTSNQRLDRRPVAVIHEAQRIETGLDKLGCRIGSNAALGIQVIVLPGRVVQPGSIFEPRLTIDRNYPAGHYRAVQDIRAISGDQPS